MERLKREKNIMIYTILWGILAHGYRLISVSIFGDALFSLENGFLCNESGRWFGNNLLQIAQLLFGNITELPFFNGLITLIIIGICNIVLINILKIEKKENIIIASGILPTFIALTVCFSFMYLSWVFALALLFSLLSLKLIIENNSYNKKYYFYLGILLNVLSLAIYQGFIGFTILGIFICYVRDFNKKDKIGELIYNAITYILAFIIMLLLYIILNKFVLNYIGEPLSSYKNVDTLNSISTVFNLKNGLINIYSNIFNPEFACLYIYNTRYIYFYTLFIVIIYFAINLYKLFQKKEYKKIIIYILIILVSPIVYNIFMLSHMSDYYSDTVVFYYQSLILFIPIMLSEKNFKKSISLILVIPIIYSNLYFSYMANCNYFQSSIKEIRSEMWTLEFMNNLKQYEYYDGNRPVSLIATSGAIFFIDTQIEGVNYYLYTNYNNNSVIAEPYIRDWIGWKVNFTSYEVREKIRETKFFEEMPCYPEKNSIKYFEEYDTIVVKFK